MDIFTRFNQKNTAERQIDTLIGLSKGLIADCKVDQSEAEFLMSWLVQACQADSNPVIINLLQKVYEMLEDGVLDVDESAELLHILQRIAGEPSEIGELAKPTSLPIDDPLPTIVFPDHEFVFTGTCVFGSRKQCHEATEALGGRVGRSVTKSVNYVVIGTYVTDSWIHETYGRKIEKAMQYRDQGVPLVIVTEEHWIKSGGLE